MQLRVLSCSERGAVRPLRDDRPLSPRRVLGALGRPALFSRAAGARLVPAQAEGAWVLPVAGSLKADAVVAALAELDGAAAILRGGGGGGGGKGGRGAIERKREARG